ncbi:probable uridine nucleosidase 2 [Pieris brassicae]|uniref:probable uridine nucleosidase 2 n=1 Tax=Pieris brassicae TaxID=7116 RepID=UPI001E66054A|nr:probable uridine nucleosidase 2 [Pieris brassicae]
MSGLISVVSGFGPKLVIDHDGGADDAMAIFMALLNEKYFNGPNVVAITTVHGNVDEPQVFNNTQRILSIADRRDIPIYRGSKTALIKSAPSDFYFGRDGLGDNETTVFKPIEAQTDVAAIALIKLSQKYRDALTIVTLGPLTNLALAMKLDPEIISRISQTYVAASYIKSQGLNKIEFNIKMDVEAYYIMIENGKADKITIIPSTQVKQYLNLGKAWRRDVLGTINTDIVRSLNTFERISMALTEDWMPLDPSAMAIVLEPSLVLEKKLTNTSVFLCGKLRGRTTFNFKSKYPNARVIISAEKNVYQHFLIKIFSANINDQNNDDTNTNDTSNDNETDDNDNEDNNYTVDDSNNI